MRPYRRFGAALTDKPSRLGLDAVRYSLSCWTFTTWACRSPGASDSALWTAVAMAQSLPAIHRELGLLSRWQKVSSCSKLR